MELDPLEAVVLVAVHRGVTDPKALAEVLHVDEESLRRVIDRLVSEGLLAWREKGLIIKRRELVLTEEGYKALPRAVQLVEEIAERTREVLSEVEERVRRGEIPEGEVVDPASLLPAELAMLLPALIFLGLVPAVLPFNIDVHGHTHMA